MFFQCKQYNTHWLKFYLCIYLLIVCLFFVVVVAIPPFNPSCIFHSLFRAQTCWRTSSPPLGGQFNRLVMPSSVLGGRPSRAVSSGGRQLGPQGPAAWRQQRHSCFYCRRDNKIWRTKAAMKLDIYRNGICANFSPKYGRADEGVRVCAFIVFYYFLLFFPHSRAS